jgi:hypothetical protein
MLVVVQGIFNICSVLEIDCYYTDSYLAEVRLAYKILVGKPRGKRPLGIPKHR